MSILNLTCSNCNKKITDGKVTIKDFARIPKIRIRGHNHFCCNEKCADEYKESFVSEIYNGKPIYFVGGFYLPYLECSYGFKNIEDCKMRMNMRNVSYINNSLITEALDYNYEIKQLTDKNKDKIIINPSISKNEEWRTEVCWDDNYNLKK